MDTTEQDKVAMDLMDRMKAEGKSDREVGYAITRLVYGESPSAMEMIVFGMALSALIAEHPDDGFLQGGADWLAERTEGMEQ